MSFQALGVAARTVIDGLADGDYDAVVQICAKSRLTSDELREVIREYGRTLVHPPADAYQHLDAVQVNGTALPTWSVRAPLWTKEEGRSDLTLELTISLGPDEPIVELDDLHVL